MAENGRTRLQATCHPERPHSAFGLCRPCYLRDFRNKFEENLRSRYNMTSATKYNMWLIQHGWCAICFDPIEWKPANIDHDHSCCAGRISCGVCIRGLLCQSCNHMTGFAKDDQTILTDAALYLESL